MSDRIINKLDQVAVILSEKKPVSSRLIGELSDCLDRVLKSVDDKPATKPHDQTHKRVIRIWSDGACTGNPGPGGWGTIVEINGNRFEYSGSSSHTTNNIMELTGALVGIQKTPEGSVIELTSDSQYLVKGMTEWLQGWKKKGWKKGDGKEVLNKDLWKELDAEAAKRTITWKWIKGHTGHPENERCDELARLAIRR